MQKNYIYSLLASAALLAACQAGPQETIIKGEITGVESDTLIINYYPITDFNRKAVKRDTIAMQNGRFSYTLPQDSIPTDVWLYAKPAGNKAYDMRANTQVLLFPGQTITLKGSLKESVASGSQFHKEYEKIKKICQPIISKMDSIGNIMTQMQRDKALRNEVEKVFIEQYKPLQNELKEAKKKYIKEHLDNEVSLYLLSQMGLKDSKDLVFQLNKKVQEGALAPIFQQIQNYIKRDEAFAEAKEKIEEGKLAPDFTLTDINGKAFTLSSLRGKYVVLDFWGSWCGWCIKGLPEMKKYYQKYQKQMEIVGIDCRDTEKKWKEAVKQHELPWINVHNEETNDVTLLYAVSGFPTKIIIDEEGKINKIVIGEDPAFYKHLDQLFK